MPAVVQQEVLLRVVDGAQWQGAQHHQRWRPTAAGVRGGSRFLPYPVRAAVPQPSPAASCTSLPFPLHQCFDRNQVFANPSCLSAASTHTYTPVTSVVQWWWRSHLSSRCRTPLLINQRVCWDVVQGCCGHAYHTVSGNTGRVLLVTVY